MRSIVGALSLAVLLSACQKPESPSGDLPKAAADAKQLAEQAPAVPDNPLDPKLLLTGEMLGKYLVYQRTMLPVTGDAMAIAATAYRKSGADRKEFEKQMAADERVKRVEAASKEAQAKSGLTQTVATEIGRLVSSYIPSRTMGTDEDKAKARADFEAKYGKPAAEAMDEHEAELTKLQDEMLEAALGPAPKK